VDGELRSLTNASTADDAVDALNSTALRGRQVEQDVVKAMFTVPDAIQPENVTLGQPPMHGLPLLALLGDALKPLIDDLDGVALYHDMGCSFTDCRAPAVATPSRNAWNILAKLEASPQLHDAVDGNPHALAGWNPVFALVAGRQQVLTDAIADAVSAPGGLAGAANESDVHPLARRCGARCGGVHHCSTHGSLLWGCEVPSRAEAPASRERGAGLARDPSGNVLPVIRCGATEPWLGAGRLRSTSFDAPRVRRRPGGVGSSNLKGLS
jgi:hypothetical protein